jgi:hypothetical protein
MRKYMDEYKAHEYVVCMNCAEENELLIQRPPLVMYKPPKFKSWSDCYIEGGFNYIHQKAHIGAKLRRGKPKKTFCK